MKLFTTKKIKKFIGLCCSWTLNWSFTHWSVHRAQNACGISSHSFAYFRLLLYRTRHNERISLFYSTPPLVQGCCKDFHENTIAFFPSLNLVSRFCINCTRFAYLFFSYIVCVPTLIRFQETNCCNFSRQQN